MPTGDPPWWSNPFGHDPMLWESKVSSGMTLWDFYAGQALSRLAHLNCESMESTPNKERVRQVAEQCCAFADAMIEAKARREAEIAKDRG